MPFSRSYLDGQVPGPMSADTVVALAWERSDLSEAEALDLAYRELREARRS
jgi:hypothetical protein